MVFYKKIFPLFWFGFLAVFVAIAASSAGVRGDWPFIAMPCFMAVVGFLLMRKLLWDLADEVHDAGDYLLVRKGSEEERVPLSNIMNVSASLNMNPPRITLRLVNPGKFGQEISFSPPRPFSFNLFAKNPVAEDLIVRVDQARVRRAG
jgi:hypothetical protein